MLRDVKMETTSKALDAPLRELFDRIEPHQALASPNLPAVADALVDLAADHDYFAPAISDMGSRSGVVPLHLPDVGPRLQLVHRRTAQMGAVHDHGVWVALAPIVGVETHRRWRRLTPQDRHQIEVMETGRVAPGTCVTLEPPDDIHDHGHHMGVGEAAYVLILLGDDQLQQRRNEWDPASGGHRVLELGDPGRWLAAEPFPTATKGAP